MRGITHIHTGTHASKIMCAIYCTHKIIVFSLFALLLLYIFHKEKYMLKQTGSFCMFIFIARVRITWWYISCIAEVLFITLFSSSKRFFIEDYIQEIQNVINCEIYTLEKICCSLISSNIPLLILTWYWHNFMFALSWTMYLFKANMNLLANTSTPDVAQDHSE